MTTFLEERQVEADENLYPIDRRDLSDRIYQEIKQRIMAGRFAAGQKLSLDELAQGFGVSVTPVRDALRLLAAEGLVELLSRRGAFVTQPSAAVVEEVYQIREILECAAVEATLAKGHSVLSSLDDLVEQIAATQKGESHADYLSYIQLDQRFHQTMIGCLGNRKLSEIYAGMGCHTIVARALYTASDQRASDTLAEHKAIVGALRRGDVEAAKAAIRAHLRNAKGEILQQIPASLAAGNPRRP
ncbi:MAG: GntR family transcriptional regulator [Chloroflexi bacterium]|nr:GntR family transcriptional regulator [Chloroflexota bacterium]